MRVLFGFFVCIVVVLSILPNTDDIPGNMDLFDWLAAWLLGNEAHGDKVSHFIAYAAVTGAGTLGLVRPFGWYVILPVCIVALGGALEIIQGQVSGRFADWFDLLANVLGVLVGALCGIVLLWVVRRKAHR